MNKNSNDGMLDFNDEIKNEWCDTVTIIAHIFNAPCVFIMRKYDEKIEVYVENRENTLIKGNHACLDSRFYCETVIDTNNTLFIPDTRISSCQGKNRDIKQGVISYLGMPLNDPIGDIFGTICVLDSKSNQYDEFMIHLLGRFKMLIEYHMEKMYLNNKISKQESEFTKSKSSAIQEVILAANDMKNDILKNISFNLDNNILPVFEDLNHRCTEKTPYCITSFELLKGYIEDLHSDFNLRISQLKDKLSISEVKICNMLRQGLAHKEIAHILSISENTVKNHAYNIRRKLKIGNKSISLKEFLRNNY